MTRLLQGVSWEREEGSDWIMDGRLCYVCVDDEIANVIRSKHES